MLVPIYKVNLLIPRMPSMMKKMMMIRRKTLMIERGKGRGANTMRKVVSAIQPRLGKERNGILIDMEGEYDEG